MGEIFVGYLSDPKDSPMYDSIGWSESEYITKVFLTQFDAYDQEVYVPTILKINVNDSRQLKMLDSKNIYIIEQRHIKLIRTHGNHLVAMTELLYQMCVESIEDDGPFPDWFDDFYSEEYMYNMIYAIADHGIFRSNTIASAIKELCLLMFRKYKVQNLDVHMGNIDPVELQIQSEFLKPLQE